MLASVVSPAILEGSKLLEDSIDRLMSSSCYSHHVLLSCVVASRSEAPTILVLVGAIRQKLLPRKQGLVQSVPADGQIRPVATRVRTIDPHNLTSLNADRNLIPETGMLELVAVPLLVERS